MKQGIKVLLLAIMSSVMIGTSAFAQEVYELPEDRVVHTESQDAEYVLPEDEITGYIVEAGPAEVEDVYIGESSDLLGASAVPTEEEAYQRMIALKETTYPEGMPWTNANAYENYFLLEGTLIKGYGCAGFAFHLSDVAFGSLPARKVYNVPFSDVHVGDILRINNDGHSVVVMEVHGTYFILAEGNFNSSIHWGRKYTAAEYTQNLTYVITRYPEGYFDAGPTCSIAYDANGGTGAPEKQTIDKNTTVTLPGQIPTKDFCTFLGWSDDPAASSPDYLAGSAYSFERNTVLYAVWRLNYVSIEGTLPVDIPVTLGTEGQLFRFVPSQSGTYTFWTKSVSSISWTNCDSNMKNRGWSVSSGSFGSKMTYNYSAGEVYYIGIKSSIDLQSPISLIFNVSMENSGGGNDNPADNNILLNYAFNYQYNLSLYDSGKIGLNFYVVIPMALDLNHMQYTINGAGNDGTKKFYTSQIYERGYVGDVDVYLYKVSCEVSPSYISDDVTLVLAYDDTVLDTTTTSIAGYAQDAINNVNVNVLEKNLLKKLVNYGAYSQLLFNTNTGNLANDMLDEADKALNTNRDFSQYKYSMIDISDDIDYIGSSVVLNADFAIRHYFVTDNISKISNYSFSVDGIDVEPVIIGNNNFYIEIKNIGITEIRDFSNLLIEKDYDSIRLNYCVMSYLERVVTKGVEDKDLLDVVYSILDFEEAFYELVS